jgi:hypothetical protein
MISDWLLFGLPFIAPLARLGLMVNFALTPSEVLEPAEQDRAGNRAIIIPMIGFAFSALLALVVLDANRVRGLRLPVGMLMSSFLALYTALNLQSYKVLRWQDQLGTGLKEAGAGWLLLSVVAVVRAAAPDSTYFLLIACSAIVVWGADLVIRLSIDFSYLRDHERIP